MSKQKVSKPNAFIVSATLVPPSQEGRAHPPRIPHAWHDEAGPVIHEGSYRRCATNEGNGLVADERET